MEKERLVIINDIWENQIGSYFYHDCMEKGITREEIWEFLDLLLEEK